MAIARDHFEAIAEDRPYQLGVEDIERRPVTDDAPVGERDDARREGRREIQIVEHRADRKLTALPELAKELERRELVPRIEMHRRLVKEKHRGFLRERHGEDRALPFAAREPVDATPRKRFELELADGAIDRGQIVG